MRNAVAFVVVVVAACGSHHSGGGNMDAPPVCDPTDPSCGTPVQPIIVGCPGCPTFPNPGSGTTCSDPATDPVLVYPPDNVLLPPNMNVVAVQFMPGNNNAYFEIDFSNSVTDVRLETQCNMVTNTRGVATGGCDFELDPTDWMYISMHNKGGDPVKVTVRGMPANASCVAGSNSRNIDFAEEDITGGIYYWQSMAVNGVAGTTGGIFRKDFGNPDPTPEPFITPNLNASMKKCVGCHYLSRDGQKMVLGDDDADSDDELGDDHFYLVDVPTRAFGMNQLSAKGFAAWQGAAHDQFAVSDGGGMANMPELVLFSGTATTGMGTAQTFAATGLTGKRITNPDWSRDGGTVYFTATTPVTGVTGYNLKDDIHCVNGSIWSVTVSGTTWGTPAPLVTAASTDENNYYPAIAADGGTLIFDRATGTTLQTHDSYNNPNAALYAMKVPGGTPVALANANLHDTLTNSWPRWAPAVQMYKGKRISWVTFSSTRDYGVRVANEGSQYFNCYPPVSPEDTSGDHAKPFDANCTQPQIWMAAVALDDVGAGADGSFPAFWLPFQDYTAHNHIAQWVDTITMPPPNCQQNGQTCSTAMPCCDGSVCDPGSMTCVSNIP
jgi:hypothetical protein